MVSACAVWERANLFARLEGAGAILCAHPQRILPRRGGLPDRCPQHPRVLAQRRLDLRRFPGPSVVGGYFHGFNPPVAGVGYPPESHVISDLVHHVPTTGSRDPGCRLHDGLLTPAGAFPVAHEIVVYPFNLGDPLRVLHAEMPGDQETDREAVLR